MFTSVFTFLRIGEERTKRQKKTQGVGWGWGRMGLCGVFACYTGRKKKTLGRHPVKCFKSSFGLEQLKSRFLGMKQVLED